MRIVIDLDGTICAIRKEGQKYSEVAPKPKAILAIRKLKAAGHTIIIHTARHMKTCEGNVGAVVARVGPATIQWLHEHKVPYDEIHFGKPWGELYIDDQAMLPNWRKILAAARRGRKK
ncbi:MAG: HAD hydrolase family protein [Candidatus Micrarchaeota archaeon]|nr:HAD hydrolase family protein [Candidatus Micrarchaeota archaeon]